jgi:hypothetical protein
MHMYILKYKGALVMHHISDTKFEQHPPPQFCPQTLSSRSLEAPLHWNAHVSITNIQKNIQHSTLAQQGTSLVKVPMFARTAKTWSGTIEWPQLVANCHNRQRFEGQTPTRIPAPLRVRDRGVQ